MNQRKSEPHRVRPPIIATECAHVVIRVGEPVGALRRWKCYRAVNRALRITLQRAAFRIVHASIQRTHVHLLVEAADATQLARGMQGFQISAARHLNRAIGRPRGNVFIDRYHATVIRSPTQCRNAVAYVLNNWRKHHEDHARHGRDGRGAFLDAFSSAIRFTGWAESHPPWRVPSHYDPLAVAHAQTWLLRAGWANGASISMHEVPSRPHAF